MAQMTIVDRNGIEDGLRRGIRCEANGYPLRQGVCSTFGRGEIRRRDSGDQSPTIAGTSRISTTIGNQTWYRLSGCQALPADAKSVK